MQITDLLCLIEEKKQNGQAKWRDIPFSNIPDNPGVYIVSLDSSSSEPEFSDEVIKVWIDLATNILIDGHSPTIKEIRDRLSSFWLPDETVLYIGQTTKQTLRQRIKQFYDHTVGCTKPHRGGQWIHTLANIGDLNIHWCTVKNPIDVEQKLLAYFMDNISEESRNSLYDPSIPLPFANLEYLTHQHKHRKKHQMKYQTID